MKKTTGEASNLKPWGPDESGMSHQNHPLDACPPDGHALNEGFKVPAAHPGGRENHSYMHPLAKLGKSPHAPKTSGVNPDLKGAEKALKTKMLAGGGKVIAPNPTGKNKF